MSAIRYLTKEELNILPIEIATEIKETLIYFEKCNLIYQNGKYEVSASTVLQNEYAKDRIFIGFVRSKDIYTPAELRQLQKENNI